MTNNKLLHGLKTRHILMIALGSAIGTGLFFGTGESIGLTGPSILLAYLIGGIIMYWVIRALGEMTVHEPHPGSFSYYAYKYIGNFAGFISGWNYWFLYIIVSMLELTATAMLFDYWFPNSQHWTITLIVLVIFTLINLNKVNIFGEFEFWFAGIKVVTIISMIIFGFYLIIFMPTDKSNIANIWSHGNFFGNGLKGFLLSFVVVVFSFGGTELVGITAAEADDPQKNIPLAINGVIFRILIFYILTLFIIMCLYPWNMINHHTSPFVDVFIKIGIHKAAMLMNIIAITAALSSFNSGIYATGRMLYNLSEQGNAPKILLKLNHNKVPNVAILTSILCIFLTVVLNYLYPKQIFAVLLSLATVAAIVNWIAILITQFAFRKKATNIQYKMPLYPYSSYIALIFFITIIIAMSNMESMKTAVYIAPIWLCCLVISYKASKYI